MNRLQTSGLFVVLACLTGTGYSGLLPGGGGGNGYEYNRPGGIGIGNGIGRGSGVQNVFGGGNGRPSTLYGAPGFGNGAGGPIGANFGNGPGFAGQPTGSYGAPGFGNQAGGGGGGYQGVRGGGGSRNGGYNYDNDVDGRPKPYSFQYEVRDAPTGNDYGQQETSDGNTVRGEYRVLLPDSRTQIVRYTADDATGYNADVQYEGQAQFPQGGAGGYQGGSNYQQGFEGFGGHQGGGRGGGGGGGYHGGAGHGVGGNGNGFGFGTGGRPNNQYLPAGVDYGK